ncbi:2-hydroxy-3-oxopropionate reductase [Enterococcus faecium]|uniref:2-hydroxy-3-oxopropionate reductase n=1 Tax=Enterococcus TaxID=1350 RepID=UPI000CF18425|nr:2-hydroxy-3-oxopropionate reductase [Enterococcus faecium]EGP4982590.1 2-hydroxy-3-oxopropionate reductase [Enterococcus faecium]EGP5542945.1 2-hydroxy-3-oxopropionate reductase [Enterococcus faecium]EGP5720303.1 2-hydroxy-3-oxopropionate reductase [Enterococcus faecium]EME7183403.1 2-hydroxy-3-oxopropionate reductase [Enterococcus faecium]EME8065640.1 2-hydroxy-3-oxopropionate reductase [Enterococcus faecium]
MKIGFVGLGIMGKPMAKNLIKDGYEVICYDFNQSNMDEVAAAGASTAKNSQELANQSDIVITMLPNSPNVEAALFSEEGIAAGISEGKIVIDMSSINPVSSQRFAEKLAGLGVEFLDAPVSGGEPKAIDGTIAVMVGGKKKVFDQCYELLLSMASSVTYIGEVGAGNIAKLANQIIVAINIAAVGEALSFATKAGADPELVYQGIRGGLAGSTVMDAKSPMILNRDFDPEFRIELHIKDLQNALDTSHMINAGIPLTAQLMEIMQVLKNDGLEKKDHSAIACYYEKINNLTIESKDTV